MKKLLLLLSFVFLGMVCSQFSLANTDNPADFLRQVSQLNHTDSPNIQKDNEFGDQVEYKNSGSSYDLLATTVPSIKPTENTKLSDPNTVSENPH